MRKLLISILLSAAASAPTFAAPKDDSGRFQSAEDRHEASSEARAERQQARETRSSNDGSPQVRSFGSGGGQGFGAARVERQPASDMSGNPSNGRGQDSSGATNWQRHERQVRERPSLEGSEPTGQVTDRQAPSPQRRTMEWRRAPVLDSGDLRQPDRPLPRVLRSRTPVVSDTPREGTQPPLRTETRRTSHEQWNTSWRHDRRYDWWDWRRRHRSHFHLGFYYDPFGWSYQPYSIGWRLWPSYYGSRYWLNDPWQYRLPYAPPGYRWIRYYDDALLVDTWNGEVVDVIHDFFW